MLRLETLSGQALDDRDLLLELGKRFFLEAGKLFKLVELLSCEYVLESEDGARELLVLRLNFIRVQVTDGGVHPVLLALHNRSVGLPELIVRLDLDPAYVEDGE